MYFECSSGTGKGNNLIVTCASDFAGVTISCTKGAKSYSRVCPSSDPYEIEFSGLESGTWTISGTVEGTLYSTSVVIVDYTATLDSGFDYKTWCTEGGIDATQYSSLADVFADELAVHRLMTVHASADYLIDAVSDDIDVIDDFVANDTAMKWIGLRDYVCDGLTAINGVVAKFLASEYWERYLKDHVPTMTSNNAPYGVASGTSVAGQNDYYKAFDKNVSTSWICNEVTNGRITHKFNSPTNIKKVSITSLAYNNYSRLKGFKIQGSNNGTTWEDLYEGEITSPTDIVTFNINNDNYYLYYCVLGTTANQTNVGLGLTELQFYGRSLNVSVPVMTSNNAPFGVASASGVYSSSPNYQPYKAFDGVSKSANGIGWAGAQGVESGWIGYHFPSKTCVKFVAYNQRTQDTQGNFNRIKLATVEGSNGDSYESIYSIDDTGIPSSQVNVCHSFDSSKAYEDIRLNISTLQFTGTEKEPILLNLQFYGVDYSEREFEPNTNKKWLYDHGLELEPMTAYRGNVVKGNDSIKLTYNNSIAASCGVTMDLTPYSLARAKITEFTNVYNYLMVTNSELTQAVTQNQITSNYAPNNISLNIGAIDDTLLLIAQSQQVNGCSQELTELWVE